MIFSSLPGRLFLLLLFAVVYLSPGDAKAQCPMGKPPNSDGTCGKTPKNKSVAPTTAPQQPRQLPPRQYTSVVKSRNSGVANNCSINVRVTKQGGEPLPAVNLMLDDSMLNIGITDAEGAFKFNNLPCNRNYKITPGLAGFTFNNSSVTITNLAKSDEAAFIASAREKPKISSAVPLAPAPIKATESRPCNPPPTYLPRIKLGDSLTGKLSPPTSFCDERTKEYFNSYRLDGALGGDIIQLDLKSDPASDLVVQVSGKSGNTIEVGAEGELDNPRQVVLPAPGDYILRVIDKSNRGGEYRLNLIRKGLTDAGYLAQLEQVYAAVSDPDKLPFYISLNHHIERFRPYSDGKSSEQKVGEATEILERLRELAPNRPEAYSLLSAINLYFRKDLTTGRDLATKALELGGEARFRVNFGEKLDKDLKRVTDSSSCWLIIRKDKISCESFMPNEGEVFTTNPIWIAKKSIDISGFYLGLTIYGSGKRGMKSEKAEANGDGIGAYYFAPLSLLELNTRWSLTEVAMIKNLIKQFVDVPH
ncbi:MAG: carboxypeptidase regulatory-like domain-containing protein [Blastocatellia bacterium]|nr:carboxypeptidase regulatory-like domain-containing protein [Blastocatellia bacterium]